MVAHVYGRKQAVGNKDIQQASYCTPVLDTWIWHA